MAFIKKSICFAVLGASLLCSGFAFSGDRQNIILDADSANEVDDLFAVVRTLIEPSWHVSALNAVQWQTSQWASNNTMEDSHRLNQMLAAYLKVPVDTKRGGPRRMYDWGDQAHHSAASYDIIKQAKALKSGEKLTVIALGALTNIASAIFIAPEIEEKIELYWLGSDYDFDKQVLSYNDFNCMMDMQALDKVFKSKINMHVMPISVGAKMKMNFSEVSQGLDMSHPLGHYLSEHWFHHIDSGRYTRTIWDLGLISAMLFPEWATTKTVTTPAEFGGKKVTYYTDIDAKKIKQEFFKTTNQYLKNMQMD